MFKRDFPKLNASPSILGFGLMRLPVKSPLGKIGKLRSVMGGIDTKKAQEMVDYAIENGVNYFDTSWIYHMGKSEVFIGKALARYPRDSYYLANKMPTWLIHSRQGAEKIFEKQLKRCGVDYFDFYLCHAVSKHNFKKYEKYALDFLIEKKKEGKIKRLGFSFHDHPESIDAIADYYPWDFALIQFNYFDYHSAIGSKHLYEALTKRNIPVQVMEPVRGGALAKMPKDAESVFKDFAPEKSIASWAIKFCMNFDNVSVVLSGMSNFEQIKDNIETAKNFEKMTENELKTLWKAEALYRGKALSPCTECHYCSCPKGINIARNFSLYNEYFVHWVPLSEFGWLKDEQEKLGGGAAKHCVQCGACESKCPQKIKIGKWMKKITENKEYGNK